jgi:hypothetical protein
MPARRDLSSSLHFNPAYALRPDDTIRWIVVRSRTLRWIVALAAIGIGYHWLGSALFFIGLIAFVLYELFFPPPQYRKFGLDQ